MQTRLTFLGAAGSVTGSRYLLEANGARLLVDCGLYQEREFRERDWAPFPVRPNTIDAILLTHPHLDHCGLLPKLAREGFRGPVYCTSATADIAKIILEDAGHIQEEDAEFKKRRHERERRKGPYPEVPLYTAEEAKAAFPLFSPVEYEDNIDIARGIEATLYEAGHTLGSSMIKVRLQQNGGARTVLFSGDIGRRGKPMIRQPTVFDEADYVLVESTYGDRRLDPVEDMAGQLAENINATVKAGGNIVIPAFALERSQEILYYLNELLLADRIPHLMVFVDSPMAVSITEVFQHHPELFDQDMLKLMRQEKSPFAFPGLNLVRTIDQSKAINHIVGTVVIIAGSGMCTGGRIKHHLVTNISRPDSTILFVGYQAVGTLGRQIVDGAKEVRILGQNYPVRARIVQINGLSGHADREELLAWVSNLRRPPKHLFVTHGEPDAAQSFAELIRERMGWRVTVPKYRREVTLD
jgi:metallo-beta-lactamase family protein